VAEAFNFVLRNTEATSVYEAKSAAFAQTFEYINELRVLEHIGINITNLDLGTQQLCSHSCKIIPSRLNTLKFMHECLNNSISMTVPTHHPYSSEGVTATSHL